MDDKKIQQFNEPSEDYWGGDWTQNKIEIFIKYLKAYLAIMSQRPFFELTYFDGFAGSGQIEISTGFKDLYIEGIALQVLSINEPKPFDLYYLVELNKKKVKKLQDLVKEKSPKKKVYIVAEDCNNKLVGLSNYLKENKKRRALAILDPYGMALKWDSLSKFKGVYCDVWILVPSGVGVNRLLKRNGEISNSWMSKLTDFLGMTETEIRDHFYKETTNLTLFGEETKTKKIDKAIAKIIELYSMKLGEVWKYVSKPFEMKNSTGSVIFHFILASQVKTGVKIADDIIKSKK